MKKKDEFYIGWSDDLPEGYRRFTIIILASLVTITIVLTSLWLSRSEGYADSRFNFGNQTLFEGIIYEYPAPMLIVKNNKDSLSIPLVNFGKSGVQDPIRYFKTQMRNNLLDYQVRLSGTVIEFDGKKWLELTEEERSLKSFKKLEEESPPLEIENMGRRQVTGEIVDPKCFFGVMKPGFGKVHLSCAVRCISGGIPPILVSPEVDGSRSYYFVTGMNGKAINDEVIAFVGFPVTVSGIAKKVEGWNVLEVNTDGLTIASLPAGRSIFSVCETNNEKSLLSFVQKIDN